MRCTLPNVPHVYVIHAWCFTCITHVIHTYVTHLKIMFHTCNNCIFYTLCNINRGVYPTHVLHLYNYMCKTGVYSTHVLLV